MKSKILELIKKLLKEANNNQPVVESATLKDLGIDSLDAVDLIRPDILEQIKAARDQGDLSENAEYDSARLEQGKIEGRIKEIQEILDHAEIIQSAIKDRKVHLGTKVTIFDEQDKTEATYGIVGAIEANPDENLISNDSPIARAILDKQEGQTVEVRVVMGLLKPTDGKIKILGTEVNYRTLRQLRNQVGIVFQNPDNQFIGMTAEDDIAFGLENRNYEPKEMKRIIQQVATRMNIVDLLETEPSKLSGGQKQRVAIAGILAFNPKILIFDEATSMLDPKGKKELKQIMLELRNDGTKKTVISITHDMEEVINADRVIIMYRGQVKRVGTPREVFNDYRFVEIHNISHIYDRHLPTAYGALKAFSYRFRKNKIYAIIGNSGSGKSTMVQHLNGLLSSLTGHIVIEDFVINSAKRKIAHIKKLRNKIAMVFQFPEYQLFKDTIEKDITFGPIALKVGRYEKLANGKSRKLSKREYALKMHKVAEEKLTLLGMGLEYLPRSPFGLSGGQKRRVAIAGILAIDSHTIIFDEPTAGLDPAGEEEMMKIITDLRDAGKTVIIVTHNMDHVIQVADEVIVMDHGTLCVAGEPYDIFVNSEILARTALSKPLLVQAIETLTQKNAKYEPL
ncbi:unnamed protein product [Didymodactylos carnosus]|uniref:ABC transporter domain-containing protein n=1 Tax=Didymodactylos carnosus TaxID=1234261 RepID=A0A8S2CQU5_9BILA|nr:unnamed protein product [Didymodactylos carnosus]CAF3496262.1 unnamed protein product [Didymodactylos carnosus]